MPEIVDLRDLVPDDIVFVLPGDREYRIPGDIDVDNAFRLLKLLVDLTEAQAGEAAAKRRVERTTAADSEATVDEIEDAEAELAEALEHSGAGAERAGEELRRVLLELLQIRQPEIDRLPFGIVACQHVTGEVLRRIGLLTDEDPVAAAEESGRDPTRRRPNAARSGRSSGSTRSSTSSASTRKR